MRFYLGLLGVLALALRSLVPSGFMLAAAGDGAMTVVICTQNGAQTITVDADGKPIRSVPAKTDHSSTALCPFATSGAIALADPLPTTLESKASYADVAYHSGGAIPHILRKPTSRFARGPPYLQS